MPNLQRDFDIRDFEWDHTSFGFTFTRLQSNLLQRIAQGEDLIHPQHIEIMGEQDPFFPRLIRLAEGFLVEVLYSGNGECLFVLHADELRTSQHGTPFIFLRTVAVEFHTNGMVYIKTFSKIADNAITEDFLEEKEEHEEEEGELIVLRATGA
ncbi:TPA: hypothetical protein DEP34_04895 [Candidatus Uhrbacteria bacterium]|uniref:Uncharacterized protein n=2 Tax=Candidatus Uhriibacteriota TaxID=1752732 RepID=A0A0G1Q737_9BACT|nr:MAG: hypothetical protein UX45_C0006G0038 [Candidatus Uhrbacteria bacterium GW2011_GWF2_46_218]KKU40871.1 MAG: hypothetical protein UX57_C0009G0038 [Candidatus Uhrbacteria bacterium GW2011_GWE2_46_68]HBK33896.1 hypothetical protein [Candidatus Uhrbacteria bacterium]HCB19679.1 hypothetical protein [Candidatus Uhrbacteria bacterium]